MFSQSLLLFLIASALFDSTSAATITTPPPFPTSTAISNGTCPTKACYFNYPKASSLAWFKFIPSATITAATVSVHCYRNSTEPCSTTTIYNELPIGAELPPTNAAGTRTTVVTSFAGGTLEVAYPTQWADYDTIVPWSGTLSTKGVCSTETGATITLPSHKSVSVPQTTKDSTDPEGLMYSPTILYFLPTDMAQQKPDELALKSCSPSVPFPLVAVSGVHFLTETTTDYGSSPATQTPNPNKEPSKAPAPQPSSKAEQPPAATLNPLRPSISALPVQESSSVGATGLPLPPVSVVGPGPSSAAPGRPAPTLAPVITFDNSPITASVSSAFVIGSQTLVPGSTITVSGTTIALGPSASFIVVNGETSTLAIATVTPPPVLTVGNMPVTATSGGSTFVVGGQTLTPGGTITFDGTTVALGPSASFVVVNGVTSTLEQPVVSVTPPPLTVGGIVYTASPGAGTSYIVSGQTLTPGGVITVNGSIISLPTSGMPTTIAETSSSSSAFFSRVSGKSSLAGTTTREVSQTPSPSISSAGGQGAGPKLRRYGTGGTVLISVVVLELLL